MTTVDHIKRETFNAVVNVFADQYLYKLYFWTRMIFLLILEKNNLGKSKKIVHYSLSLLRAILDLWRNHLPFHAISLVINNFISMWLTY